MDPSSSPAGDPVPPPRGGEPRSIRIAKTAIWLQFVYFVCGGLLPFIMLLFPFGVLMIGVPAMIVGDWILWPLLFVFTIGLALGAAWLSLRISEGDPSGRTGATVASLALAAYAVAVGFTSPFPEITLGTAAPWIAIQVVTLVNLHTPEADRWFRNDSDAGDSI
ncbi:hypothetical protein O1R50_00435 [Glycomyces luteolus]|uniref:Uncharacterized protein n=1 Tax=Glycomyces luteolus TaxID=2670330 RepID=A0A9X3P3M5_9ACTN|nr:hypothetical protein [Glycomyces luteolus]MDA1358071.1 hypothetical protein [Glycomyces luteolus]